MEQYYNYFTVKNILSFVVLYHLITPKSVHWLEPAYWLTVGAVASIMWLINFLKEL